MTTPSPTTPTTPTPIFCRHCNYDLRGTITPSHASPDPCPSTARCPECGTPFNPANPRSTRPRPARLYLRPLRRAAYCLLTVLLLLAATWLWFYWGWHTEQQALRTLKLDPNNPDQVASTPILSPGLKEHLGSIGFVFDRVVTVNLTFRSDVTDLAPLSRFTHVQRLFLADVGATDLSPLSGLTEVQILNLQNTRATDLAPLSNLRHLEALLLSNSHISNLASLASLPNLQELYLEWTDIVDLAPLSRLPHLKYLYAQGTRVTDVSPLSSIKSLRVVLLPAETTSDEQVDVLLHDLPSCRIERQPRMLPP